MSETLIARPRGDTFQPTETGDSMLTHEAMAVESRGRCYTTEAQRRRLGIDGARHGYGTELAAGICTPPTWVEDGGRGARLGYYAETSVVLGQYGEFTIPIGVRRHLGVSYGDVVLATLIPT